MRFSVLGSGSKGNALVVEGGGVTVLIDAGYSPRETRRRLQHLGIELRALDGILLTHGHGDHMKGAKQIAGALGIPTYATEETKRFCAGFGGLKNHVPIASQQRFKVGGLEVLPVATPHDAPGSVCFVVDDGMERVGVCTDLGVPSERVAAALATCDAFLLEHNYDEPMLRKGPYPESLKRRVASARGHLSNEDGARLLAMAMHNGLSRVLLGHLSEVNNTPTLALGAARPVVDGCDVEVSIAPQHHPTDWLRPHRARRPAAPQSAPQGTSPRAPHDEPASAPGAGRRHAALERQLSLFAASSPVAATTTTTTRRR